MGAAKASSVAKDLKIGDRAPDFTLPADGDTVVRLSDFKGKPLVLFFYPKADTPGCTTESKDFSRLKPKLAKAGVAVLGVSADPVKAQDKFKAKHRLTIPLASDETHQMLAAYGAWGEKSMYGRKFLGVIRKTVLIDSKGKIAQIWPKVSVAGHAAEVLLAAEAL
jgi:thioredoxin-dependent peroxiredoxin